VSRRVFYCEVTWKDRRFQKDFSRLNPQEQMDFLQSLEKLRKDLEETPHPATDPKLRQAYRAKSYSGVVALKGAQLIEYSLGPLARVIAKYPASEGRPDILLLAVTLLHDHERLKRILRS
jgi:hypothetical protein